MGIERIVETTVTCDVCGEAIGYWSSYDNGVSKGLAGWFVRREGATATRKRVVCKQCRIDKRIEKCALIKKMGIPVRMHGRCRGFETSEKCRNCIANADVNEERAES